MQLTATEQQIADARLRQQVHGHAAPGQHNDPITPPHALDRLAVPDARQGSGCLQPVVLRHAVTAEELRALGREHANAGVATLEQQAQALEGRLGARQEQRRRDIGRAFF